MTSVQLAVHSLKDLPTSLREGLCIAATPDRVDPRDVLVGPEGSQTTLATLENRRSSRYEFTSADGLAAGLPARFDATHHPRQRRYETPQAR